MTVRAVSYGGGVQSTALLVLAAQGYIDFPLFLFANVGDDSEDPETLRYLREVAFDYAAAHGIELHELHRRTRDGEIETLYERLIREGSRSLPIPVRMPDTGAPGTRNCTMDFKIRVVGRWLQTERGASAEAPAVVGVGISTDEHMRANSRRARPYELLEYPLLNLEWQGGIGLNRNQCEAVIRSAGLPVPPKSSCYFCPFHRPSHWADMARDRPVLFEKTAALEDLLNDRRDQLRCPGSARRPLEARTRVVLRGDPTPLEVSDRDAAEFDAAEDSDVVAVLPLPYGQPSGACPTCHRRFDVDPVGALPEHERGPVFFSRFGRPLREVFGENVQLALLADPAYDADDGYRCGDVCDT